MRAVNLIPSDQRRAGTGSPAASYAVLAALALVLLASFALVRARNTVSERGAEKAGIERQAAEIEARAAQLKPYGDFALARQQAAVAVSSLAASRFAWDQKLAQLARVVPDNVTLSSLAGSTAGSGVAGPVTIGVEGCTERHRDVSELMVRLRAIDDVSDVSLSKSTLSAADKTQGAGTCARTDSFSLSVVFTPGVVPSPAAGAAIKVVAR